RASAPSLLSATPPATTRLYALSLHDALPIFQGGRGVEPVVLHIEPGDAQLLRQPVGPVERRPAHPQRRVGGSVLHRQQLPIAPQDRKSTRLNSSHVSISYAVFCLKKKKKHSK